MDAAALKIAEDIDRHRDSLARDATERHAVREPMFFQRYGERARQLCLQDAHYHLSYLAEAVASDDPRLFSEYLAWVKVLLAGLEIPETHLLTNIDCLMQALSGQLTAEHHVRIQRVIQEALAALPLAPARLTSLLAPDVPLAELSENYLNALLEADRASAERMIFDAVDTGVSLPDIYLHVFQRTQREIGRRWQMNLLTVAHEHYCTACTQLIMSCLSERLFDTPRIDRTLLAAGVEGELHDVGVRMVADFFELEGWDTIYLGANTPTTAILKYLRGRRVDVLAIGATMTFHVRRLAQLIREVRELPQRPRILVGGYPFLVSPQLWSTIGADVFGPDAAAAVERVMRAA